jgi:hypothetical protein
MEIKHLDETFNVKQLCLVAEYYGLGKARRQKKADIILMIVLYERDVGNTETVMRRRQLWHYMEELASDKMMKKYIIW